MRPGHRRHDAGADRRRAVYVLALFAAAAALDAWRELHAPGARPRVVTAEIFSFIVAGISWLVDALAAGAAVTVSYLATVVSWIGGRLANLIMSSGAMFARVWDGIKIVWADVLKPALVWVDDHIKSLYGWLRKTFKPVFDFLDDVRARLLKMYARFVRPVLDTIDYIRQINAVLRTFHITVLDELDHVLADVRRYIDEPFQWLLAQLARVQNVLDRIVDGNGFFQKYALVASLRKHAPLWISHFWADQVGPVRGKDGSHDRTRDYPTRDAAVDVDELVEYFNSGAGARASTIDELALIAMQTATSTAPAPAANA